MYTRKQYLNKECTHREYYAQFVTDEVRNVVERRIGVEAIKTSDDPHFNDIPLLKWDTLFSPTAFGESLRKAGDFPSLGSSVCIAKEAARQIKEN